MKTGGANNLSARLMAGSTTLHSVTESAVTTRRIALVQITPECTIHARDDSVAEN